MVIDMVTDRFNLSHIGVTSESFLSLINQFWEDNHRDEFKSLYESLHSLNDLIESLGREFEGKIYDRWYQLGGEGDYVDEWSDEAGWDMDGCVLDTAANGMLRNVISQPDITDIRVVLKSGMELIFKEFELNVVSGTGDYLAGWLENSYDDDDDEYEDDSEFIADFFRSEMNEAASDGFSAVMAAYAPKIEDRLTEISEQFRDLLNSDSVN